MSKKKTTFLKIAKQAAIRFCRIFKRANSNATFDDKQNKYYEKKNYR